MTAQVLELKRGDTAPQFRAQLLDDATPVNLSTAASAKLLIRNSAGDFIVNDGLVIEPGTAGWVNRDWETSDLAESEPDGRGEVEVTWADGKVQTFPRDGYFLVLITADLG